MNLLVADIGNSSVKLMRPEAARGSNSCESVLVSPLSLEPERLDRAETRKALESLLDDQFHWFVSSVNANHAGAVRQLAESIGTIASWREVTVGDISLVVDVEQPESTGIDRLLAAQAAKDQFARDRDVIVIDCGTALTIDLVTRDNRFQGGVIMAGPSTHLRALASMTAALPDLTREDILRPERWIGKNTRAAMLSGVWLNGLGAIREVVSRFTQSLNQPPQIVGTGGGLGPWRDELPEDWIIVDNLVIDALIKIAERCIGENQVP